MLRINVSKALKVKHLTYLRGVSLLFASSVMANNVDNEVLKLVEQPQAVAQGKKLFESVCAACHGRDLSGGAGFNLKDGEWIHGSNPSDIITNISNGFSKAGMPAFAAVYNKTQLKNITAYILSKREGFDNLTYKLYELKNEKDFSIEGKTPVKTGKFDKNLIDFQLPEIQHYALEVEGDFYTVKNMPSRLYLDGKPLKKLQVELDGKKFKEVAPNRWFPFWQLKPGKQHLKITLYSGNSPVKQRNLNLLVTNNANTVKFFPVSTRAKAILDNQKVDLTVKDKIIVHRRKVSGLPARTISVGYPQKVNYAFNAKSCSIVGVWDGDLLNIGPNVLGRGEGGSVPLGDFSFKYPQQISPDLAEGSTCHMVKYNVEGDPAFYFNIDNKSFSVTSNVVSSGKISFKYKALEASKGNVVFNLPKEEGFTITSSAGKISGDKLTVNLNEQTSFSIDIVLAGSK